MFSGLSGGNSPGSLADTCCLDRKERRFTGNREEISEVVAR